VGGGGVSITLAYPHVGGVQRVRLKDMKLLVLTSEPVSAQQLRDAIQVEEDPQNIEVMVVAPALAESPVRFWFSDADAGIERAEQIRSQTVGELQDAGLYAQGTTGEADPTQAVIDALQSFPADRVVVFTHGGEDAQRHREDIDVAALSETVGLPVDAATV